MAESKQVECDLDRRNYGDRLAARTEGWLAAPSLDGLETLLVQLITP